MAAPVSSAPAPSYRPAGTLDLATALAPYRGPWNARLAAHLARRAGFGGTAADAARLAALTAHDAVDSFIHFADTGSLPAAPEGLVPLFTPGEARRLQAPGFGSVAARRGASALLGFPVGAAIGMIPQTPQPAVPPNEAQTGALAALIQKRNMARRQDAIKMQQWWLDRMIASPAPLQEKMTLFWHGHFTSSLQKGTTPDELVAQNQLFRKFALGNVRELALEISRDPAMLKYLDNARNVKAHPNENYARELMELFTLGIGNYTETDVRESARAFTGWSVRGPLQGGGFVFNAAQHDDGSKTFLGRSGTFDGADIVRIIYEQPAAADFIAGKLLSFFVYSDPEPELVAAVGALVRKNNFELAPVMSTVLRSNVFFSDRAYRALVKSPVEFAVGTYRLFGIANADLPMLAAISRMGQVLFYPPSVKGWDGGAAWLSSQTMLTRENFAAAVAQNPKMSDAPWLGGSMTSMHPETVAQTLVREILQGDASPVATARLVSYLGGTGTAALGELSGENVEERVRGAAYLAMATPAYQLA